MPAKRWVLMGGTVTFGAQVSFASRSLPPTPRVGRASNWVYCAENTPRTFWLAEHRRWVVVRLRRSEPSCDQLGGGMLAHRSTSRMNSCDSFAIEITCSWCAHSSSITPWPILRIFCLYFSVARVDIELLVPKEDLSSFALPENTNC